jgi:hypothetical protein
VIVQRRFNGDITMFIRDIRGGNLSEGFEEMVTSPLAD